MDSWGCLPAVGGVVTSAKSCLEFGKKELSLKWCCGPNCAKDVRWTMSDKSDSEDAYAGSQKGKEAGSW